MISMIEGLKPCPLCKFSDIHYYQEGFARKDEDDFWFIDIAISHCIECNYCGHLVESMSYEGAKEEWNRGKLSEWEKRQFARTRRIN